MRWLLLLFLALLSAFAARAAGQVHLILSEPGGAYEDAAAAFRAAMEPGREVQVWSLAGLGAEEARRLSGGDHLLVPIGLKASRFVAEHHAGGAAVLSLLVPMNSAQRIAWPDALRQGRLSSVYIDQPIGRSLTLIETLLPKQTRIGLMVSPDSLATARALEREAARRDMSVNTGLVDEGVELGEVMRGVLSRSEVLLLLPDALVSSGANLQSLLLASYRMRIPVIGFSPGLVKAGAVAAVFASPEQIGRQGGAMARRWLASGSLPGAQYSSQFSVDINSHVARSLGLALPTENEVVGLIGAND